MAFHITKFNTQKKITSYKTKRYH